MKTILLAAIAILILGCLSPAALGQMYPDVELLPQNVNFSPGGPVSPGTPVLIQATTANIGNQDTVCDIFFGAFDGITGVEIGRQVGVAFLAGLTTFIEQNWDTTGFPATSTPVNIDIFNCNPADNDPSNNQFNGDFELPVELSSFAAIAVEGGIRINWVTESEIANLGFNVFRATGPDGPFTSINADIIKAAGTTPYRHEYTFLDSGVSGQGYHYYIEDVSLSGQTGRSWLASVVPAQERSAAAIPLKKAAMIPENQRANPSPTNKGPFSASFTAFKILVDKTAITKITYADLRNAGANPGLMDLSGLSIRNKGVPVPVQIQDGGDGSFDPGDFLQFRGTFNRGTYTHEDTLSRVNVYWLSWSDGAASPRVDSFATDTADGPYSTTLHFEKNSTYSRLGDVSNVNTDHWFWEQIGTSESKSFKINLEDVAGGTATIRLMLHGNTHLQTNPDHQARIYFNGEPLGNIQWDGQNPYLFEKQVQNSHLMEGENILTVEAGNLPIDSFFMNWAEVDYLRNTPVPDKAGAPLELLPYDSAHLKSPENAADYVVITHRDFLESARRLAEYRETKGMRTKVVEITDIYDEFSNGLTDYTAIRSFLKYAYTNWQGPALSYVVLFGDAYEDPKNNRGLGLTNFIPAHPYVTPDYAYENESETFGLSYSDHLFATLDGDDMIPEVSIGRLPVSSREEADVVVQKIIDYETNSDNSDWQDKTLFINGGYDPQEEVILDNTSEHVITSLGLSRQARRVYMSPDQQELLQFTGDKSDVIAHINRGAGLVNYLGHAGAQSWDLLFQEDDVPLLDNYNRLPFVMSLTCWTGTFTGERDSLGELLLKGENGGAIAFLGSTSAGLLAGDSLLDFELFKQIFQVEGSTTLGKIVDRAKTELLQQYPAYGDFVQTYELLGDPALELKLGRAASAK